MKLKLLKGEKELVRGIQWTNTIFFVIIVLKKFISVWNQTSSIVVYQIWFVLPSSSCSSPLAPSSPPPPWAFNILRFKNTVKT